MGQGAVDGMRVGFVGLGAMGLPMARRLIGAGHAVAGYDLKAEALDALAESGGRRAQSVEDAGRDAGALVLMVVNAAQAEAVLADDVLRATAPGALVLLMSTCAPAAVAALAARVEAAGRRLIDAPVSGGVVGATGGTLSIMAAAPDEALAAARPLLDALGDKVFHVGPRPGQGAAVKVVNQLLCGVHIVAVAEALSLAERAGLDGQQLLTILGGSAAGSWMLRDRGPRMLEAEPGVTSAVDIFVKDLGLVLEAGGAAKAALPLAAVARQMFLAASGQGRGGEDDSQVVQAYRALSGIG